MEVFDSTIFANDDDDPKNFISNYASLSQFDLDLQQQAQAAMQQGAWQDIDMFLPQLDCPNLFYNAPITPPHAFPTPSPPQRPLEQTTAAIGNNSLPLFDTAFMDDATLYSQASALLPGSGTVAPAATTTSMAKPQMPVSPPLVSFDATPVVPSQWNDPEPKPEPIGSSPILSENVAADSSERHLTPPPDVPPTTAPAATSTTAQPWSTSDASAKVPIQRLKPPVSAAAAAASAPTSAGSTPTPTTATPMLPSSVPPGGRQQKKTAHNAIERRYRNNINDRITELKNAVPALVHAKLKDSRAPAGSTGGKRTHRSLEDDDDEAEDGEEYMDGVAVATKLNKATILRKATEYITHLKKTGEDMRRENTLLQQLLAQLPGGHEVLGRYQMQKVQREQEMQRQRIEEKQMMVRQQQQQRKSRKRTRTHDEYPASSSPSSASSDPLTPPAAAANVGNRVFMALFASLAFFSSSPLTTGPSSAEQFQNHQHAARTTGPDSATVNTTTPSKGMTLDSLLPFEDGWSTLRTAVFVVFLAHLLLPLIGAWLWPFSLNVRRVSRSKRLASHKRTSTLKTSRMASAPAFTPGDQKCFRIYDIVVKMLESNDDGPPRTTAGYVAQTLKEASRFVARHTFGYEILYNEEEERLVPEDEWEQACRWIKLNEIESLGGNPEATRWTMLHSCLRMLNLVEVMEDEEHPELSQMRARVYATAAMQLSAMQLPFSTRLVRYLLGMAVYEPFSDATDGDVHMRSLVAQQDKHHTNLVDSILSSQAWLEALDVMRHQMGQSSTTTNNLSLSLAAPVVVPVAVLSTLQHLDHLQLQFDRLISGMASSNDDDPHAATTTTASFFQPSPLADSEQQQLAFWLAAVGMTVESLWRNDDNMSAIEQWMETVVKRVPRSLTSTHGGLQDTAQKKRNNQLDEMIKKSMVLVLVGAVLIKRGDVDQGVEQLERAEQLRGMIKKLMQGKKDSSAAMTTARGATLETVVLAQAEFAVAMVGLEAWITAWKHNGGEMRARVREAELDLRRMIRRPPLLKGLTANQVLVARLSRLGVFVSRQPDEVDSASDTSDLDDNDNNGVDTGSLSYNMAADEDDESSLAKHADRALDILHGVVA